MLTRIVVSILVVVLYASLQLAALYLIASRFPAWSP